MIDRVVHGERRGIRLLRSLIVSAGAVAATMVAGCLEEEHVGGLAEELTAAQCSAFAINGKVQVCHRTSSAVKPYTIIRTDAAGCINGHTNHVGDYVASTVPGSVAYDPTCNGQGCFPAGAPHDGSVECCEGLGPRDGVCADLDECALGTDACDAHATCTNTIGGYTCACDVGYDGDGFTCADVDECAPGAVHGGLGTLCRPGDRCQDDLTACPERSICTNTDGGFTCACDATTEPFVTAITPSVVVVCDPDECLGDPCTDGDAGCANHVGGFMCYCPDGTHLDNESITCDGCVGFLDNCSEHADCIDRDPGFECRCQDGYAGDGVTCTEVDACVSGAALGGYGTICSGADCQYNLEACPAGSSCHDEAYGFTCTCDAGHTPAVFAADLGNAITCDPNECETAGVCGDPDATCTELQPSFACTCPDGETVVGAPIDCADAGGTYCTYTQGGWGSGCPVPGAVSSQPGCIRDLCFPIAFPTGISLETPFGSLTFDDSAAVAAYLPAGGDQVARGLLLAAILDLGVDAVSEEQAPVCAQVLLGTASNQGGLANVVVTGMSGTNALEGKTVQEIVDLGRALVASGEDLSVGGLIIVAGVVYTRADIVGALDHIQTLYFACHSST